MSPAKSAAQYRLAEAVAHGTARTKTSMPKKVARELIAATPAKQRSEFARTRNAGPGSWRKTKKVAHKRLGLAGKPAKRKNFLGLGSQVTSSSRLSRTAYHQGFLGKKDFEKWLDRTAKGEKLHSSFVADLRREYSRGESARIAKEKARASKGTASKTPASKTPALLDDIARGQAGKPFASLSSAQQATIRRMAAQMSRNPGLTKAKLAAARKTMEQRVTKAAAALRGNPRKRRNPTAEITLNKAHAYITPMDAREHQAQIVAADGSTETSPLFKGAQSFKQAMNWARVKIHHVANPKRSWKLFPKDAKRRRKNPEDASIRMYEKFHGLESTEVREYVEQEHRHSWMAGLGPLVSMKVRSVQGNRDVELEFPDPAEADPSDQVMLCANEDGTQLFCVGGDQELPQKTLMNGFGMVAADFARDNALIGTILELTYRTRKSFEKDGDEEIDFYHELGSEGSRGVYPVLEYKTRAPHMVIVGGRYYIGKAEPALGGVSAGIIG